MGGNDEARMGAGGFCDLCREYGGWEGEDWVGEMGKSLRGEVFISLL